MRFRFAPDIPLTIGPKVVQPQPPQGLKPAGREHLYVDAAGRMSYAPPLPPAAPVAPAPVASPPAPSGDAEPAMLLKVGSKIRTGGGAASANMRNRVFTVEKIEGGLFWVHGVDGSFCTPRPGEKHARKGPDYWAIVDEPAEAAPAEMLLKVGSKIRTGSWWPLERRNKVRTVSDIDAFSFWVDGEDWSFDYLPELGEKHSRNGPECWVIVEE